MINRMTKAVLGTLAVVICVSAAPQIASAGGYGYGYQQQCKYVEKQVRYYDKYTYTYKYRTVRKKVCY